MIKMTGSSGEQAEAGRSSRLLVVHDVYDHEFDDLAVKLAQQYLALDSIVTTDQLNIVAVVISGSMLYRHVERDSLVDAKDLDGACFVRKRTDLLALNDHRRHLLRSMLGIIEEERPHLVVPPNIGTCLPRIDGVRFAGFSSSGLKISFKILALESFENDSRSFNILSCKDKRVYEGLTIGGLRALRLQQNTKLGENHCIMHDPWLFTSSSASREDAIQHASFGVTADLIITGHWLMDPFQMEPKICSKLIDDTKAYKTGSQGKIVFTRSRHFGKSYRRWLGRRLNSYGYELCTDQTEFDKTLGTVILNGISPELENVLANPPFTAITCLSHAEASAIDQMSDGRTDKTQIQSPFASNSSAYIIEFDHKTDVASSSVRLFQKVYRSLAQRDDEVNGSEQAALWFPLVQRPTVRGSSAFYAYFDGISESDQRLDYLANSKTDMLPQILDIEMRKAEDILRAYQRSMYLPLSAESCAASHRLHRFYHERLHGTVRLKQFYASGIAIEHQNFSLDRFLSTPLRINGVRYPCLAEICARAEEVLDPKRLCRMPAAFGLGDAHGGNILVRKDHHTTVIPAHRLLYIDYEVSGFHTPALDLAKPIYCDVFFAQLYSDILAIKQPIDVSLQDGELVINLDPCNLICARGIAEIKFKHLLEPVSTLLEQHKTAPETWVPCLAYGLFACALLTRNFSNQWDALFINIAIGVQFTDARSLSELRQCFDSLIEQPIAHTSTRRDTL